MINNIILHYSAYEIIGNKRKGTKLPKNSYDSGVDSYTEAIDLLLKYLKTSIFTNNVFELEIHKMTIVNLNQ